MVSRNGREPVRAGDGLARRPRTSSRRRWSRSRSAKKLPARTFRGATRTRRVSPPRRHITCRRCTRSGIALVASYSLFPLFEGPGRACGGGGGRPHARCEHRGKKCDEHARGEMPRHFGGVRRRVPAHFYDAGEQGEAGSDDHAASGRDTRARRLRSRSDRYATARIGSRAARNAVAVSRVALGLRCPVFGRVDLPHNDDFHVP
jgi:hypothetical protein